METEAFRSRIFQVLFAHPRLQVTSFTHINTLSTQVYIHLVRHPCQCVHRIQA